MSSSLRAWAPSILPGGVICVAALGFLRPTGVPPDFHGPVEALPYLVLPFGVIFGWFLSSSRLLLSVSVLALAGEAVAHPAARPLLSVTATLLPLNVLALCLLEEETLFTRGGAARCAVVLVQAMAVWWLSQPEQAAWAFSWNTVLTPWPAFDCCRLPQPVAPTYFAAAILIAVRFLVRDQDPVDAGSWWALLTSFIGLCGISYGWAPKPFFAAAELTCIVTYVQWSHRHAYRDALTALGGRRSFEEAIRWLPTTYAVAVVGFDQLKQHESRYGKAVREQLLRRLASMAQSAATSGTIYRVSGDEFTILFEGRTATEALAQLETIRNAVEQSSLYLTARLRLCEAPRHPRRSPRREPLSLTASIGVAGTSQRDAIGLIVKTAYRALYEAKASGGNVVRRGAVLSEPSQRPTLDNGRIVATHEYGI